MNVLIKGFEFLFILILSFVLLSCQSGTPSFSLENQISNTSELLIGLHAIDENLVWASGTNEVLLRTVDGGVSWQVNQMGSTDSLQFRDVFGFDQGHAFVLSSGTGSTSRIYEFTLDDGFQLRFTMLDQNGFLNSMDFWDEKVGIAFGDAIDAKPYILKTVNGGQSWSRLNPEKLPDAAPGEGGFAASGTSIELGKNGKIWIGTGAAGNARILYSGDYGENWMSLATPMVKGELAGITSVRFRGKHGIIVGGDLNNSEGRTPNSFISENGGIYWEATSSVKTTGPLYCAAIANTGDSKVILVTGPNGADISLDFGKRWVTVSRSEWWTAEILNSGVGWMAGRDGTVMKIRITE